MSSIVMLKTREKFQDIDEMSAIERDSLVKSLLEATKERWKEDVTKMARCCTENRGGRY
jgi:hypothetical protein